MTYSWGSHGPCRHSCLFTPANLEWMLVLLRHPNFPFIGFGPRADHGNPCRLRYRRTGLRAGFVLHRIHLLLRSRRQ